MLPHPEGEVGAHGSLGAGGGAAPLLRVAALTKAFGATQALSDGSFELCAGEIHALVGENGSGKSTLVKIVSGVYRPDGGTIELGGESIAIRNPQAAQRHGVVTVFQEVLVAGSRSVLENIWLGSDTWTRRTPPKQKRAQATEAMERLLGRSIDLDLPAEDLSLGDRQACCIARALVRNPRVLILDESTAALDFATRDRLFGVVRDLAGAGVGVVIITHRMDELSEIGDRLTVLRSGATVATVNQGEWAPGDLVHLMTGTDARADEGSEHARTLGDRRGAVLLSAKGLKLKDDGEPIDLTIEAGVLTGVAGLEGHGGNEFLEALRGSAKAGGQVVSHLDGDEVAIRSPRQAADLGVVYVPRERRSDSLVGWMSIRENFALATLDQDSRFGWLSLRSSRRRLAPYTRALGMKYASESDAITTLSGGNQQKVVIARWLAYAPRVLILNDPTRGVSISTKRELYKLLSALASEGVAVVMLSSELDEHIELMDRVLVFRERNLSAVLDRRGLSRERLVGAFFGAGERVAVGHGQGSRATE
ncbi:MAG: sugar ABC transporter ATP-binding protein [Solirubrobacteraceae bacterium]